MKSLSLRARVLTGLVVVAIVLTAVAAAVTITTQRHLVHQIDTVLAVPVDPALARDLSPVDDIATDSNANDWWNDDDDDDNDDRHNDFDGRRTERLSSMFEGTIKPSGELVPFFEPNLPHKRFSSPDLTLEQAQAATSGRSDVAFFTVDGVDSDVRYRASVLAVDTTNGQEFIVRALPLDDVDETVRQLLILQASGLAIILILLAAVGWWVVRLGVNPIKQMTRSAQDIAVGDLDRRLPETSSAGTESGELARTLNGMLGRIQDAVTEQERSEDRLRQFVADASHELRTPVTTIRGYAELYRHGGLGDKERLDDAMRRTEEESQRMGRLVNDMLELAKLDQQRPLASEPVNLSRLALDAANDARVTAPEREITTQIDEDLIITGDQDRLRQVIGNVVGNAITHTDAGTAISVAAQRSGDHCALVVVDSGEGMDAEVAARVTERFFRADASRSRVQGGSGLGLAITEGIVEAHGGTISVQSEVGVGTSVTILLPASDDQNPR